MTQQELTSLLSSAPDSGVAVIGDFCLDAYWTMAPALSERSVETGLMTRPVGAQRYAPGGAGAVVNNLRAIGVGAVKVFGVIGADPFGEHLEKLLKNCGADTRGLLRQEDAWETHVYAKPLSEDKEEGRIDFGVRNRLSDAVANKLADELEARADEVQAVIVNEQIVSGIHANACFRNRLAALILRRPDKHFILDSRNLGDAYPGAIIKLNAREAVNSVAGSVKYGAQDPIPYEEMKAAAETIYAKRRKPVVITRGDRGSVVRSEKGFEEIPGLLILGQTDPVGAGDSSLAAFATAVAGGTTLADAARFGGFAAGVTVQKLHQTGTASPAEIMEMGSDPNYVFKPELAEKTSGRVYAEKTDFELTGEPLRGFSPTHAVFDHDGTISTLRVGWEEVMEPVMVASVFGTHKPTDAQREKIASVVREMIDKTTGIRTIAQMEELVKIIRHFGFVPEHEMSDAEGYKKIYLDALMNRVRQREADFRSGKTKLEDVTMKGSVDFLKTLHERGTKLYLASGTDRDAVIAEATLLGYAGLFEGRIYGAEPGATTDAKKTVIRNIFSEIGANAKVLAIGDGMVEMRESKKAGGAALGVASDEIIRSGLNESKRSRLIRGGADMIIPDFGKWPELADYLWQK